MKIIKRVLPLFLILALVLGGCQSKKDEPQGISQAQTESGQTAEETPEESPEETERVTEPASEAETSAAGESEAATEAPEEATLSFAEVSETVWAVSNVNIRTAPNTDSEVITVLAAGQSVTRTGYGDSWSKVDYNGQTCYISSEYLTAEEPQTQAPAAVGGGTFSGNGSGHIVAIDPGHQAHGNSEQEPIGPGASETKAKVSTGTQGVATGVAESVLNLNVSLQLKAELLARGYQVVMIRETQDVNLSNAERAAIANSSGAEIFLRIHANGSANPDVNGIVTMCPTAGNPYVSYLYDSSYRLSALLADNMCAATGANNQGVLAVDNMSGINWCTIPVSIIEMGYMSNPTEDTLMNSADYQAKLVQGMANAVDAYFGN